MSRLRLLPEVLVAQSLPCLLNVAGILREPERLLVDLREAGRCSHGVASKPSETVAGFALKRLHAQGFLARFDHPASYPVMILSWDERVTHPELAVRVEFFCRRDFRRDRGQVLSCGLDQRCAGARA